MIFEALISIREEKAQHYEKLNWTAQPPQHSHATSCTLWSLRNAYTKANWSWRYIAENGICGIYSPRSSQKRPDLQLCSKPIDFTIHQIMCDAPRTSPDKSKVQITSRHEIFIYHWDVQEKNPTTLRRNRLCIGYREYIPFVARGV